LYQTIILAGGLGKRIKKIANGTPKILIKIKKKNFLYFLLKSLEFNGIKNIIICTGYGHQAIKNFLKKNIRVFQNLKIYLSYEGSKRLGTAGAIKNAYKFLNKEFIIIYGDNLLEINFQQILKKKIKKNKKGIMIIKKNNTNFIKSNVYKSRNNFFYEKFSKKQKKYFDYGLLILKKEIFKYIRKKKFYDLSTILENLSKKKSLQFLITKKNLIEIGSIQGINIAKKKINEFHREIPTGNN
jgi:NDP-sugar pyrophosphorylase family protein